MARKKANYNEGYGGRGHQKSGGPFHFLKRRWVWRFILFVVVVAVLFWLRSAIVNAMSATFGFFGWGLLFIAAVVITVFIQARRRKLLSFITRGNRWLGGIAFALAAWGVLAIFEGGGAFGWSIIGGRSAAYEIHFLFILGLVLIGVVFMVPGACFRLVTGFASWVGAQFRRRPVPKYLERQLRQEQAETPGYTPLARPSVEEKPALMPEMERPTLSPEKVIPKSPLMTPDKEPAKPRPTTAPVPQDLRQVAEEVWKKYGQSPDLVTVDGWRLPPIDILDMIPEVEFGEADNIQRAKIIEDALGSYGVEAKVVQINAGPTVTQFGVEPGWDRKHKERREKDRNGDVTITREEVSKTRVKVERITSLANDLALALAAPSIRIEAPVPGKSIVGIEVPNTSATSVSLRGVIETSAFQKLEARSHLALAMGKGAGGESVAGDLSKMPHLLIAGATGSGKTVCLNTIISCLLLYNTPFDVRFIMIDPKRVELTPYNSIPHLATPVIVDTTKALSALRWLSTEMDQRYQKLATAGARNIEGYNKNRSGAEKMPYMVLIIDELADLMMAGFDEVEHILCRLAQLARAIGIHLIVATQRPSVDVVTGLIKANFPTRISFAVTSQVDSRTILDGGGAEKLLGRGDMLYMPTEAAKPKRIQGCFISDAEVERLVYFWNGQRREEASGLKIEEIVKSAPAAKDGHPPDPLLESAQELAEQHEHISTSFLQRRLHIGYPRAARLMEQLEEEMGSQGIEVDDEGEGGEEV
ncbi:MAG: Flp pilus assembly complex ATPase component TadA [Chloroflexi bacterium]|nr:Flp pilus assembly complex ATPase component TadA [Chloroflexota bacterium]